MKRTFISAALFGAVFALSGTVRGTASQATSATPALVKVTQQISPHFPIRLLRRGVTEGEAVIRISLDQTGKLSDCLVERYTEPEFAEAALDAIKQWQFKLREPVGVVMGVTFLYRMHGVVAIERFAVDNVVAEERNKGEYAYAPCSPRDLDHRPKPTRVVSPDYPQELEQKGIEGSVAIDFYIDEQGRTRLPAPLTTENSILAGLATAAMEQWQFEPPTRGGKPVLVHATQRFSFVAKKP